MVNSHPAVLAGARAAIEPLLASGDDRILVGIAGPPAAGKSTLAATLASALEHEFGPDAAVAVPMDGFHLANAQLSRLGLTDRKGAPETFDGWGFAALLARLRSPADGEVVYAPEYSRVLHESIGGAIPVPAATRIIVVEGNYLLLPEVPWTSVRKLLDLVLYLDAATPVRVDALLRRQRSRGLAVAAAQDWVHRSDEVNAALIETTKRYADAVLTRPVPL
ncbi:nucleoside/nucleotide kinase family protein [Rugosimonospora acidiphila]|uniref:Nucleoside/nucleotide kinase family protein n=1 Tax=Rugosimonospora acidiphila TaxID=556531 RepID=A0ABP9S7A3_9ACTN